jgi:triacylglycerol lipase
MTCLAGVKGPRPFLRLYVAGHSLGGALSTLAVPDVARETGFTRPIMYNFGSPRVGDEAFARFYNRSFARSTFRVFNTCDAAVSVPPPLPIPLVGGGFFTHVDTGVVFTSQKKDLDQNHCMDTYMAALGEA